MPNLETIRAKVCCSRFVDLICEWNCERVGCEHPFAQPDKSHEKSFRIHLMSIV